MAGAKKFEPRLDKEYIVTDQCFWKPMSDKEREEYNPYDKDRMPHGITLVDRETGTTVNLLSGSIIKVVKAKEHGTRKVVTKTQCANPSRQ